MGVLPSLISNFETLDETDSRSQTMGEHKSWNGNTVNCWLGHAISLYAGRHGKSIEDHFWIVLIYGRFGIC